MATIQFKPGRPPTFSPELCESIIADVKKAIPYHLAAEANGIHANTLGYWLRQGKADLENNESTEKAQFYCNVKKAIKEVLDELLAKIRVGGNGWQGSAWILERRWWKDWSSKVADLDFNERLTKLENERGKDDGQS